VNSAHTGKFRKCKRLSKQGFTALNKNIFKRLLLYRLWRKIKENFINVAFSIAFFIILLILLTVLYALGLLEVILEGIGLLFILFFLLLIIGGGISDIITDESFSVWAKIGASIILTFVILLPIIYILKGC